MSPTTRYTAEITDPVTGDVTTVTAVTEPALEEAIDTHLQALFPLVAPSQTSVHQPDAGRS